MAMHIPPRPDFSAETQLYHQGYKNIAGVDEVGRGPIAGPVTAAAVILNPAHILEGINDSKKLTKKARTALSAALRKEAIYALGWANEDEIDALNIRIATHLAMRRALNALPVRPDYALIDGRDIPAGLRCKGEALIKGDNRSLSIAAASIIAKHARDALMATRAQKYPFFGWEKNAGYPTKAHLGALKLYGITQYHRKTFSPIHNIYYKKNF